jgi:hypothetical protein
MKQRVVAILLASIAVYVFGFLYWGVSPLPYIAWHDTKDDAAAQQAIRQYFPASGTYFIPSRHHTDQEKEQLFKGPVGFVHIKLEGRPVHDISIMIRGFIHTVATMALIAMVLGRARASLPGYVSQVSFVTLLGATASLLHEGGETIWWGLPEDWQAAKAAYNVGVWVVAGLVIARFDR